MYFWFVKLFCLITFFGLVAIFGRVITLGSSTNKGFSTTILGVLITTLVALTLFKDLSLYYIHFSKYFFLLLDNILCIILDFILFIWFFTTSFTIGNNVDIIFLKFRFGTILLFIIFPIFIFTETKKVLNFLLSFRYM